MVFDMVSKFDFWWSARDDGITADISGSPESRGTISGGNQSTTETSCKGTSMMASVTSQQQMKMM